MRFQDTFGEPMPTKSAMAAPNTHLQDKSAVESGAERPQPTKANAADLETMMLFLRRSRDRALTIRENSPAGSYLESVLNRTITGIDQELSQLTYLLAKRDLPNRRPTKMRPAL
ncbi:hypothetical protein [Labrenzia sp. PHM005]|uniref:hypothetical protein n=1 Tax=Labrenzia sp. PHM005 TaxID=2590016 RepID=UPI00113FC4D0|nr:hypothetical protein [Labrenzia sp. PHM005]QDG78560.1 hypothetical protein FJ695_23355 [Labrenzia sp. PHM005]